jgi:hypothetical protein
MASAGGGEAETPTIDGRPPNGPSDGTLGCPFCAWVTGDGEAYGITSAGIGPVGAAGTTATLALGAPAELAAPVGLATVAGAFWPGAF